MHFPVHAQIEHAQHAVEARSGHPPARAINGEARHRAFVAQHLDEWCRNGRRPHCHPPRFVTEKQDRVRGVAPQDIAAPEFCPVIGYKLARAHVLVDEVPGSPNRREQEMKREVIECMRLGVAP